jgi:hypothetical protein
MSLPINPLPSIVASLTTLPDTYAGIYNPCRTLVNEHRPVCTKEYHLTGKYLDGTDNPDVWLPLTTGGGNIGYAAKLLTLTGAVGAISATRCVIDGSKFPITSNFIEFTIKIGNVIHGVGTVRTNAFGFMPAFTALDSGNRAMFYTSGGLWYIGFTGTSAFVSIATLPIGRQLVAGDICTVRLDRQDGSANIDIARFYVNGQLQYETTAIPTVDCYAGIGVFTDASVTTAPALSVEYVGCKYVP